MAQSLFNNEVIRDIYTLLPEKSGRTWMEWDGQTGDGVLQVVSTAGNVTIPVYFIVKRSPGFPALRYQLPDDGMNKYIKLKNLQPAFAFSGEVLVYLICSSATILARTLHEKMNLSE